MNNNETKLESLISIIYPPFLYFLVMVCVEAIADIVIFIGEIKKTDVGNSFVRGLNFQEIFSNDLSKYTYVINAISAIVAIGLFLVIYIRECSLDDYTVSRQLKCENLNKKKFSIIIVMAMLASTGIGRLVYLLPMDHIIAKYQQVSRSLMGGNIAVQFLTLGILVPIAEELVYRGVLLHNIRRIWSDEVAITVVSLLFGIFHFNILQGIYAFIISIVLVYFVIIYDTIVPGIVFHGVANATTVILSNMKLSEKVSDNILSYLLFMVIELAGFIFLFVFIYGENKRKNKG